MNKRSQRIGKVPHPRSEESAPSVDANPKNPTDPLLSHLADALANEPGVTLGGKGFGSGALKVNGKIFAMRTPRGELVFKLPKSRVDALVAAGNGERFEAGKGRVMTEWLVATSLDPDGCVQLAAEAHAFVSHGARGGASKSTRSRVVDA